GDLMKDMTGLNGKAQSAGDAFKVARSLNQKKIHLGVFQGFEFAWVQQKYPQLQPLVIAIYHNRHPRTNLIVHKNFQGEGLKALRGKDLAIPKGTKGHARLFLERDVKALAGAEPQDFFKQITRPDYPEAALDKLCDGEVDAALIDDVSFDTYALVKSALHKRLRVLKKSEVFPATVVVHREGGLDSATLDRLRKGMLNATKNTRVREFLEQFHITAFEPVPSDYQQTLSHIRKVYPAP